MSCATVAYKLVRKHYVNYDSKGNLTPESIVAEFLRITGPQLRETIIKEFTLLGNRYIPRNALNRLIEKGVVRQCALTEIRKSRLLFQQLSNLPIEVPDTHPTVELLKRPSPSPYLQCIDQRLCGMSQAGIRQQ